MSYILSIGQRRLKIKLIYIKKYLLILCRYIELNPVRADMVEHPSDYPWSSYRCNALGQENPLITPHYQYQTLGTTHEARQRGYRTLFKAHIREKQLEEIRAATNKEWVLGSDYFKDKIAEKLKRRTQPLPKGGDRKSEKWRKNYEINRH